MKILQINSVCGIGSTGRIATDLYHILKGRGHECKVAYGRGEAKNIPTDDTIKIGTNFDVNLHGLMTRMTDRTGFYSKKATLKLIDEVKKYNPDVIHLHNIHGYYLNIELLFRYLSEANKPVVWTLHDCWPFTGHCAHFDFVKCSRWKTGCHDCLQKHGYPQSIFFDASERNYRDKKSLFTSVENLILVTPSRWLGEIVEQSFLKRYRVQVIPNGIDLNAFKPTENDFRIKFHLENKVLVLGVASAWSKRKGLADFVQLSKMLDARYQIILVGLSTKQIRELPQNIIGISRTNDIAELAALYTATDVFVNPTYEDNFPTTNLEALACGTPVITYRTGGSPESIDDTCGVIVPQGDIEALCTSIQEIGHFSFCKADIISRAHCFDKTNRFGEYLELYKMLI